MLPHPLLIILAGLLGPVLGYVVGDLARYGASPLHEELKPLRSEGRQSDEEQA